MSINDDDVVDVAVHGDFDGDVKVVVSVNVMRHVLGGEILTIRNKVL